VAVTAATGGTDAAGDGGGRGSPADRLAELLEQFSGGGAGYRAYVERLHEDGEPEYLGAVSFDENFYDAVRAAYGGGRFSARVVEGKKYRGRVPPFRIGGKPRDDASEPTPTKPASVDPPAPTLADAIAGAFKPYADRLDAITSRLAQPPADPIANAVALVNAFRSIAGPTPAPAPATGGTLEMVNSVLELQDRLAERLPRPATGSGVADAIREITPLLTRAFEGNQSPAPVEIVSPRPFTRPTEHAPAPIVAGWLAPFVGWKRQLLAIADTGRDPELYAAVFNDALDESTAAQLVASINAGTLITDIFAAFPELNASAERRIFAGKLVSALEGLFEDETAGDASSSSEAPAV
jgi:hypothetical protein